MMNNHTFNKDDLFSKSCLFSALTPEISNLIFNEFEIIYLQPSQVLFNQGEQSDYVYVLLSGELLAFLTRMTGTIKKVAFIKPFDMVGELGVISGEVRSLTIEAISDCCLLKIPGTRFIELCMQYPMIHSGLSGLIIERSIQTIKLFGRDSSENNITFIYSFQKSENLMLLEEKFRNKISNYGMTFVSTQTQSDEEIMQIINDDEKSKNIYIFMHTWKDRLIKQCRHKNISLYLLYSEFDRVDSSDYTLLIYADLKTIPTVSVKLVLFHPENTKSIVNTRKWLNLAKFDLHHHVRSKNDDDFNRLIRFMTGNAFTVVLGGGGAKGLLHLGVIKAILDAGIKIDAIGGTSIGATVSAFYAYTNQYSTMLNYFNRLKTASRNSLKLSGITWPIISLFSASLATKELLHLFENFCIEDLWIPYFSVSANLTSKSQKIHTRGLIWEAVRSSAAVPGIFPPLVNHGDLLFDGGLINNLPVDVMKAFVGNNQTVLASCLSKSARPKNTYSFPPVLTLSHAFLARYGLAYQDEIYPPFMETFRESILLGSSANETQNGILADILVSPDLSEFKMLSIETAQEQQLIDLGYKETMVLLNKYLTKQQSKS